MTHGKTVLLLLIGLTMGSILINGAGCTEEPDSTFPVADADTDADTDSDSDADSDTDADPPGDVTVDLSFNVSGDIRSECSSGSPARPFGNAQAAYAAGSALPQLSYESLSNAVLSFYDDWKATYLGNSAACGADRYYVKANKDQFMSISEGHGFGMIIMAYLAGHDPEARIYFDGMVRFYQDHPSDENPTIMAWAQDVNCNSIGGVAGATDGDMDIAYALLLAHKQWGSGGAINYLSLGEALIDAIMESEVDNSGRWLLLGDWVSGGGYVNSTRPSDFMPGHMAAFELLKGDGKWLALRNSMYGIFADVQNNYADNTGFLPDFVREADSGPYPAEPDFHESAYDGDYYYNACRVPMRLAADYLVTGNNTSRDLLARINYFIQSSTDSNPESIAVGYTLEGAPLETTYTSWAFIAPFGPGAMVNSANQDWVNAMWNHLSSRDWQEAYYEDTIKLLSLIIMSGNWWAPQDVDC
jgi:endoglucanase